jgi:hypothetical protein
MVLDGLTPAKMRKSDVIDTKERGIRNGGPFSKVLINLRLKVDGTTKPLHIRTTLILVRDQRGLAVMLGRFTYYK